MWFSSRRPFAAAATLVVVAGAALTLGACGGGGSSSSKGEKCPATVDATVKAGPGVEFDTKSIDVKAGKVVVKLVNVSSISHTFQIHGVDGEAAVDGSTKTSCATFDLAKGTYTFFCGISGHEAAGMKGTITAS